MNGGQPFITLLSDSRELENRLAAALPDAVRLRRVGREEHREADVAPGALLLVDCLPDARGDDGNRFWPPRLARRAAAVIVIAARGDMETVRRGIRQGAASFLSVPVDAVSLERVLASCMAGRAVADDDGLPADDDLRRRGFCGMLGAAPEMKQVFRLIRQVADSDCTVLISGESGTGKELVARAIYRQSERSRRAFVPVNCAAIPRDLLESELFGYVKGSFTGAVADRMGRVEMADGGVLFLDEIADMEPMLQVKMLRVLQEREIEPLGSRQGAKRIDVRFVAATNRDLEQAVRDGSFREDLFFRLSVVPVTLPPLRRRTDDLPCLVEFFLDRKNRGRRRPPVRGITDEALALLAEYPWPGNVRELENVIERVLVFKDGGYIQPIDLPEKIIAGEPVAGAVGGTVETAADRRIPASGISLKSEVTRLERELILQALEQTGGVKEHAAQLLQVNRTTLIEKMKRNRIDAGQVPGGHDGTAV
ncbi:MAG: sigma-54-dependent Fis family transcriptional regulator [Deltaproteobacteria bacterium]|nr:sigma-54-dependent Fis family transcriptional regulator [Candidatus Anaeroferrophillacea bacterium]